VKRYALVLGLLILPRVALAQDSAPPVEESGKTDQTHLSGQLGGTWSSGNSKSYSANFQTRVSHRRGNSQLTWSGVFNYGRATAQHLEDDDNPDAPEHKFKTDSLYYTRLRYDHFFYEKNTVFLAALAFRDSSSGFRARYSPYFGYERILIAGESFKLWTDLGYRFAHEILFLDQKARQDGMAERRWVHGPLLTLGMELKLNETLDLDISVEAQQALNREKDLRFFSVTNLTNRIGKGFALGMNFNARYHREPIGDRSPLDTQLQVVALLDHTIEGKK
jgi:putative salt-induced outer membrane protein YdiY